MAESEEELDGLLMRVKEENEKASLKLNIQKTNLITSYPNTSRQTEGRNMEALKFHFLGLQNYCGWWLQPWN